MSGPATWTDSWRGSRGSSRTARTSWRGMSSYMVVQTADYVYVMEFKLDGSAEQALQQIEEKQYDLPFAADSRNVFRIGVNFSSETRNIDRWIVE